MTPEQAVLVQSSWAKIVPIADQAATLFYRRLFALDPSIKALFKGDMREQGRMLISAINTAVDALENPQTIVPMLQDLGRRHAGYGVRGEHYTTVGAALLWTLEQGLGDEFTAELKDAWTAVYGMLADTMRGAAVKAV